MCQFFESVKVIQGQAVNLDLHEERINRTRRDVLGLQGKVSLENVISTKDMSLLKCRIVYKDQIEKIEIAPYKPKKIEFLKIIFNNDIQYNHKSLDRKCFEKLMTGIPANADILIIRNDRITDTSYSNIIFWDGSHWFTPSEPLLAGIKRECLLRKGLICMAEIKVKDLKFFRCAKMINAMLDLEDSSFIEIRNIR